MQKFDKFYRIFRTEINALESSGYIEISKYVDITVQMQRFVNKSNGNRICIFVDYYNCYYLIIKNNKVVKEFTLEKT